MSKNISNKPLKKLLHLVNNKFKFEIIFLLSKNKLRFGELKTNLESITQQLLAKLLKELERDNIINRRVYDGFPRKVEYSLTLFGRSLQPVTNFMLKWEKKNIKNINKLLKKKELNTLFDYY